jgi:hypothetical protein
MNWELALIVDGTNLITSKWNELDYSNNRFGGLQNNVMHVLNNSLLHSICPMHFWVFLKT